MQKLAVMIFLAMPFSFASADRDSLSLTSMKAKTINVVYGGGPHDTVDLRFRATASVLRNTYREDLPSPSSTCRAEDLERLETTSTGPTGRTDHRRYALKLCIGGVLDSTGVLYDINQLTYLGSPSSGEPYIFLSRKEAS